jgi:hypothetical protein
MGTWFWGQWDYLWAWLDGGRRIGAHYDDKQNAMLDAHCTLVKSCGWFYPFDDFCIITDRPEIIARDDRGRPHSDNGPALRYRDGYSLYASHGVRVPTDLGVDHSKITVARIDAEQNAEVRRVLIGWFGMDRYLRESGATVVHEDFDALGNPRRLFRREQPDDEAIVAVEVTDSTPVPDGEARKYVMRVDPTKYDGRAGRECHAAIASTWRRKDDLSKMMFARPEDYAPVGET